MSPATGALLTLGAMAIVFTIVVILDALGRREDRRAHKQP